MAVGRESGTDNNIDRSHIRGWTVTEGRKLMLHGRSYTISPPELLWP